MHACLTNACHAEQEGRDTHVNEIMTLLKKYD